MKELEKNLEKTYKRFDVSVEILERVHTLAVKFVESKMPYDKMIELSILNSNKVETMMAKEEAISTIMANLLILSEKIEL